MSALWQLFRQPILVDTLYKKISHFFSIRRTASGERHHRMQIKNSMPSRTPTVPSQCVLGSNLGFWSNLLLLSVLL